MAFEEADNSYAKEAIELDGLWGYMECFAVEAGEYVPGYPGDAEGSGSGIWGDGPERDGHV